jgi:hypothetical protein
MVDTGGPVKLRWPQATKGSGAWALMVTPPAAPLPSYKTSALGQFSPARFPCGLAGYHNAPELGHKTVTFFSEGAQGLCWSGVFSQGVGQLWE